MLSGLDAAALIGYLIVITGTGIFFSRRNKSLYDYMFGGGRMPWPVIGISLIATSVSATTFLGNPADTFGHNMTYLMCNVGVFTSILIVNTVFIPRFRRFKVTSAYEILEQQFSHRVRLLASIFYACHLTLRTGILLFGPAIVLAQVFGMNIYLAIVLMAVLAIIYTYFGGLQAVVWTDVLQFFVLMGGGCIALYYCAVEVGSLETLMDLAAREGKSKWLDFSWDPSQARTLLSAGLIYTVFEVAIRGCDQQFVQRYLACKDTRSANLSSLLSAVLGLLVGLIFYWVGAGLYVYFEVAKVRVLPPDTGINHVFPYFILEVLPAGLTGLLVAAIFAAAMSSLDSAISALANTTIKDFYRSPKGDDGAQLRSARRWVILWGIAGTLAAFVCVLGQKSLLTMALFVTSLFTGPLLGLFLFAFFRPNTNPRALFAGAIGGMISLLPFSTIAFLPGDWWEPIYPFSWPWNPVISLGGTFLFTLLIETWLNWWGRRSRQALPPV